MITIISTTNRMGSITSKVAMLYSELINQMSVNHQIFDLSYLPNDFIFSNLTTKKSLK